jgi:hypothetical protein
VFQKRGNIVTIFCWAALDVVGHACDVSVVSTPRPSRVEPDSNLIVFLAYIDTVKADALVALGNAEDVVGGEAHVIHSINQLT